MPDSQDDVVIAVDLPASSVHVRWSPTAAERRWCATILDALPPLADPNGEQRRRWEVLRGTAPIGFMLLRNAPLEDVGYDETSGSIPDDPNSPRLSVILIKSVCAMAEYDDMLRQGQEQDFRSASERFEADVVELRRVLTTAAGREQPPVDHRPPMTPSTR